MKKSLFFIAILIVLEIVITSVVYTRFREVAYNGDALYEAQVARNILDGKGYVTSEMPLYALDLYQQKDMSLEAPWVNTHKFALPVFLKLICIKLFGDSITSVTFFYSYIFHFLTVLLIYAFALRLWPKNYTFAFLSAFIFLINPILGFGTPYIMISGLNLGVDAFLFLALLYVLHAWWQKRTAWLLFAAGIMSGIGFLDRYNSGLYIVATFLLFAYIFIWQQRKSVPLLQSIGTFTKKYLVYFSGFILVVAALVVWNLKVTGHAFMSINGLFQLLFDTKYNSFVDPWYKIEYVFETDNPVAYALQHPIPLVIKWFKYAALDVIRFVAFENVLWWTPLVVAYFMLRRTFTEVAKSINFVLLFVIGLVVLQVAILPLWAGSIAYFFYLFPPFCFVIAYVLYSIYASQKSMPTLGTIREVTNRISDTLVHTSVRNIVLAVLVTSSLALMVYSSFSLLFQPLSIRSYLVLIFSLCVIAAVLVIGVKFRRYILIAFVILGVTHFISQTGVLNAPTEAEILRGRWDLEGNPNDIKTLERLNTGGLSLSITPWNTVWWSDNSVSALPLPEYPDQIYLLEQKYGQQIDSLYLNKISLYPFKYIPYAWTAYERAVHFGYGFDAFDVVQKTQDGIILGKNNAVAQATSTIDVGAQSGNSHLIWGWSENKNQDGITYASAGVYEYLGQTESLFQGTRTDEKKIAKQHVVSIPDITVEATADTSKWYAQPQAEVTFLAYEETPTVARIAVRSAGADTDMTVLFNGNLLYRDEPGIVLGTYALNSQWQVIEVQLDPQRINKGINKLSFVFNGVLVDENSDYADFDYIEFIK